MSVEPAPTEAVGPSFERGLELRLADLLAVLRMQWRLIGAVALAFLTLSMVHALVATRIYASTASVHLSTVTGQELKVDKVVDKDVYNRLDRKYFTETQIQILESRTLREEVVRRYRALGYDDLDPDAGPGALHAMTSVAPRRNSEILDITVSHRDPERAAVLANLTAETYRERNLESVRDSAREARAWLDQQLATYEEDIREATRKKLKYQTEEDLADADEVVTALSARLEALNKAMGEVNTARVQLQATVRTHEALAKKGQWEALAKDFKTPLIAQLHEKYGQVVTEAAAVSARYGERHPERQRVEAELAAIEAELKAEVGRQIASEEATLSVLVEREAGLQAEMDLGKTQLLDWHERHEAYEKLAMELERVKGLYEMLAERRHELDLVASTQLNNVRLVDSAVARATPVRPQVLNNLVMSLAFGLAFGLVVAVAREWVDDTVATPIDVTAFLRVPCLGVVPQVAVVDPLARGLYTVDHPTSAAAEAMRGVRTVLEMNPAGETLKRVVVTSALASEGKTSTSVWLAVAFAQMGRRVVVVDCDLRRPRLHTLFQAEREGGVSDWLSGRVQEPTLIETRVPGLSVLTAGPRGSRAVELLGTDRMRELLALLDERFDVVILDTPPSGIVSDAAVLSRLVDGVVHVVKAHTVSRAAARGTIEGLLRVNARVLGAVVNGVDPKRSRARYYYHYGYDDQYRYGAYDEEPEPTSASAT